MKTNYFSNVGMIEGVIFDHEYIYDIDMYRRSGISTKLITAIFGIVIVAMVAVVM